MPLAKPKAYTAQALLRPSAFKPHAACRSMKRSSGRASLPASPRPGARAHETKQDPMREGLSPDGSLNGTLRLKIGAVGGRPRQGHSRKPKASYELVERCLQSTLRGRGEKLKNYAERNITATHEFIKQLTQAKDFQDILRIQTEFMQAQLKEFDEQTRSLREAFTKAAATSAGKTPFKTSLE